MNHATLDEFSAWAAANARVADAAARADLSAPEEYGELLAAAGVGGGDGVVLAVNTGSALLPAVIATLRAGAVPVFVPPGSGPARVGEIAAASRARAVLTPGTHAAHGAARRYTGHRHTLAVYDGEAYAYNPGELILTTSGTSGGSSGCLFDFERLLLNARMHAEAVPLGPDDRVLVCLPICFSYAFVAQVLASFLSGATLYMSSPPFSADSFAGALREHRITSTSLTPYLVRRLLNAGAQFPEGLRVLTVGGDALSVPLVRRLLEARPGRELYVTYGLTEAGPRVSTLSAHAEPPSKWHTVGLPLSGVRVRGGEGGRCGPLSVRTPSAMLRRVGPVEGRGVAGPDGWLETGDVFCRDEDGYLSFVGRSSEFVVINGEKVCLSSVRRVAQESAWVSKAATQVIKEGDEVMGYRLVLHLHPSVKPGQLDLRSVVRRLRFAERPSEVTVVESTPEGQYK